MIYSQLSSKNKLSSFIQLCSNIHMNITMYTMTSPNKTMTYVNKLKTNSRSYHCIKVKRKPIQNNYVNKYNLWCKLS